MANHSIKATPVGRVKLNVPNSQGCDSIVSVAFHSRYLPLNFKLKMHLVRMLPAQ